MTLYELEGQWKMLWELADDPEIDEETFADTLEALEGEIEVKAEGYAKIIRTLEAEAEAMKAEAARLELAAKARKNRADKMLLDLQNAMTMTGKPKFRTDLFSFAIQKNPPSVVMDEPYIENIPAEYLIPQEPKIDRTKIKNDIKAGKNLEGIAHLEQGEKLRIR